MNIKCPNCGAVHSLDSLINDADASAVLRAVLEMDAEMGKAAIRYVGLFRPAKSQLSWARTAKLLNELIPMIKAHTAVRDGVSYPAPAEAWLHGFNETVNARDQGRLKLPLKSHGYLLEIVSPEYDPIRLQAAFNVLQVAETWPHPAELLRNLPPRLVPRAMLAKPTPDKEKGRQKMAEVKDVLNKKGH